MSNREGIYTTKVCSKILMQQRLRVVPRSTDKVTNSYCITVKTLRLKLYPGKDTKFTIVFVITRKQNK